VRVASVAASIHSGCRCHNSSSNRDGSPKHEPLLRVEPNRSTRVTGKGGFRRVSPVPECRPERPLTEPTPVAQPWRHEPLLLVESECGAVAVGRTYLLPPLSSGGASLVRPWLRFHTPLIEPDMQICRVAQPLLAFAPTEPTMRRYRSGLFRKDRRRIDHLCQACWITGSGSGRAVRSLL